MPDATSLECDEKKAPKRPRLPTFENIIRATNFRSDNNSSEMRQTINDKFSHDSSKCDGSLNEQRCRFMSA